MKRTMLSLALALSGPAAAWAQSNDRPGSVPDTANQVPGSPNSKAGSPMGAGVSGSVGGDSAMGDTASSTVEPKKHLVAVDVYLRNAINNSKVLYETSRMSPSRADSTLEKEEIGNIDRSLSQAQLHLGHLKAAPESQRLTDTQNTNQLQGDLTQARNMVSMLRRAITTPDRTQLTATTGRLFSTLRMADDHFGQIADAQNLTRVDRIEVPERQPVGGSTGQGEAPQRQPSLNRPAGTTVPLGQPGATMPAPTGAGGTSTGSPSGGSGGPGGGQ